MFSRDTSLSRSPSSSRKIHIIGAEDSFSPDKRENHTEQKSNDSGNEAYDQILNKDFPYDGASPGTERSSHSDLLTTAAKTTVGHIAQIYRRNNEQNRENYESRTHHLLHVGIHICPLGVGSDGLRVRSLALNKFPTAKFCLIAKFVKPLFKLLTYRRKIIRSFSQNYDTERPSLHPAAQICARG